MTLPNHPPRFLRGRFSTASHSMFIGNLWRLSEIKEVGGKHRNNVYLTMNSVHSIVSPINCCWYSVWPTTGHFHCCFSAALWLISSILWGSIMIPTPLQLPWLVDRYWVGLLLWCFGCLMSTTNVLTGGQAWSWSAVVVFWLAHVHYTTLQRQCVLTIQDRPWCPL